MTGSDHCRGEWTKAAAPLDGSLAPTACDSSSLSSSCAAARRAPSWLTGGDGSWPGGHVYIPWGGCEHGTAE